MDFLSLEDTSQSVEPQDLSCDTVSDWRWSSVGDDNDVEGELIVGSSLGVGNTWNQAYTCFVLQGRSAFDLQFVQI